ncbi:MAG: YggS family pyridoxal phosphate-dependent enzyme [Spirochaetota bacterium]
MSVRDNYIYIQSKIAEICAKCGRHPSSVILLPVSKTFPADVVQQAIDDGITIFGENRVQEAQGKIKLLSGDYTFHLIGHLQSNKAATAVELFDCIHSIDKISTARKVAKAAGERNKVQRILLQINTTGEHSKSGADPDDSVHIAREIEQFENLSLEGLMTIGPLTDSREQIRESFALLRKLKETVSDALGRELAHLSMGMSGDYDIAIQEGATIVRIGSAIFGKRDYVEETV